MKIALGTVQFGMNYGVSNNLGQTRESEVEKILQYAARYGVNILDTAPSYGNSNDILGKNIDCNYWNIVTKTPHFMSDSIGNKQIDKLFKSIELSQKKLGKDKFYGLLIHNYDDLFLPGGDRLFKAMEYLKKSGVVKKLGVSLYSGEQVDQILDNYSMDLVQLPVNILDQRLVDSGQLAKLKKYGIEVHARSIFLQGLLLMQSKDIPSWFEPIMGTLDAFHLEAKRRNMSALQLALGFVQSIDMVDKVVIGVNTLKQMREIISAASIQVDTTEFSRLSISNPTFLNPSNWKI